MKLLLSKRWLKIGIALLCVASSASVLAADATKRKTTTSGLAYEDLQVGTGSEAQKGAFIKVHYTGWLSSNGAKGKKFESSYERGTPIPFVLGEGRVIKGWDEGILGMKVGGKRLLVLPPKLAYGEKSMGELIPANSTLIFEVELLEVITG